MSLRKSKCWNSNNCLHFLKRVVQFGKILLNTTDMSEINNEIWTKDLIESGFFFFQQEVKDVLCTLNI
jgi:hypothetical protein